jgi:membrane protein DedA with SNARE-associated domain
MHHYAPRILLVAKITSGLVIPSLVAAGLVRVPWKKWFPPVAIGEIIWTGSLVFIGYHAANLVKFVEKDVQWFVFGSTFIFILVLIVLVRRALQRRASRARVERDEGEDQVLLG